ncbi:Heterokaryon incompatibility protein Het-C [Rhizoctonia solani]|uniref:Heterokaryon incompatibility protein Het-C n=1 Tax=Rhizoctonia solani TaxID=456999 RepID=A0A8H7HC24_9AGAM|nr:Heterokaryon incompatibility protein Het-C [Rhizoctonia solani]
MSAFTRSRFPYFILICVLILICLPTEGVYAFGAGNIPSYSHMEGKAFRHGDIEDTLAELAAGAGKGLLGISALGGAKKFTGLQIKRIYFGNWLRDYSQAMDIAGLKRLQKQSIINLVMVLGFLAHGYATNEFEVTEERLGGYGDGEDPRQYHPKLRAAIDPRELEVDYRTGMKNYIGNGMWPSNTHDPGYLNQKTEDGPWDTSKGHIRRVLEQCIEMGRRARSSGRKEEEYESLRLLGTALHTLEDFPAHSNFCELALVSLGYNEVFVHMGDQVRIQAPNGRMVAPLVTGTFGGSDFIHSLLGEATDHISEASVSDLTKEFDKARSRSANQSQASAALRELIFQLPGGGDNDLRRDMEGVERLRASTQPGVAGGTKPPEEMSPQELHAVLWQVLKFRDSVAKKIEKTIEKIPGLGALIEKITDNLAVFIYTTLEPFMKPILQSATTALQSGSAEVINSHDQYEVFNDPHALNVSCADWADDTLLAISKDHFGLILNEPAGNLAKIILSHSVKMVVNAWDDHSIHPRQAIEPILACMYAKRFRAALPPANVRIKSQSNPHDVARRLSRESVRNHQATRLKEQGADAHASGAGYTAGLQAQQDLANYFNNMGAGSIGNIFSGHGSRELSGDNIPPSGPPAHGPPPIHVNTSAIPATGEAGQYYGSAVSSHSHHSSHGSHHHTPSGGVGGFGFPSPSFNPTHTPPAGSGYNPTYGNPPPPSFPGGPPAFPSAPGFPAPGGGYPPNTGFPQPGGFTGPPYGGAYGTPPGPPPFPGGPPGGVYGQPPFQPNTSTYPGQGHGHNQGGYNPNYGGGGGW